MSAPDPDVRMQYFVERVDWETGTALMMSLDTLKGMAARLPVSDDVPRPIAEQLRVSRELLIHSYYVYEFGAVAVAWSLLAVESALRSRLQRPPKTSFAKLIETAHERGLLSAATAEAVDAGRRLRNTFSHPTAQQTWSYGMVVLALMQSHAAVVELFESVPEP